jgi:hypothetical protein
MLSAAMMSAETFVFLYGPADQKVLEMAEDWVQPVDRHWDLQRRFPAKDPRVRSTATSGGTFRKMNGVLSK